MNLRMIFAACAIATFGSSMLTIDALGQKQSLYLDAAFVGAEKKRRHQARTLRDLPERYRRF